MASTISAEFQIESNDPVAIINQLTEKMSLKYPQFRNLVFIDEVTERYSDFSEEMQADWSDLNTSHSNVDLCIGFSPMSRQQE